MTLRWADSLSGGMSEIEGTEEVEAEFGGCKGDEQKRWDDTSVGEWTSKKDEFHLRQTSWEYGCDKYGERRWYETNQGIARK